VTTYRLDRRFTMPAIGLHLIGAGLSAVLAFLVWGPLGVLTVLLLLNALRLAAVPPPVARTDDGGVRLGGPLTTKAVRIEWSEVEGLSVDRGKLFFERADGSSLVFPLAHVRSHADDFVRDVYQRLNTAYGYSRFDPSA
jgi:hypothetical protein